MNEVLKVNVGKKVTVFVSVIVDGVKRIEYVQGILKNVVDDVVIVTQHIPFYHLLIDNGETITVDREIPISSFDEPMKFM